MRQVDSPKTASLLAADMTAAEIYESVTNGGASDFAELVTVLNRNKPWCLIGGLAVNCYVEPVYTVDVDLVVVAANLEQIGRELEAAGFRLKRFEHSMNGMPSARAVNLTFSLPRMPATRIFSPVRPSGKFLASQSQRPVCKTLFAAKCGLGRMSNADPQSGKKTNSISCESPKHILRCAD